ncbi:asparagine-linked glycosylation 14 [Cricetulus griseus]
MVSLLILAAAAATVVILLLVVRLWAVIRPLHVVSRESLTPLIVAGSGGHTTEILRLVGSLSGAYSPRHYVIADSDEMSAKKIESFEHARTKRDSPPEHCLHRIPRSREVRQSWLSSVFTTLHSMWFSFPLVYHLKPDLITTLPNALGQDLPMNLSSLLLGNHSRLTYYTCSSQDSSACT